MATRKIVHIDESKCNGCGMCVPSCAEGAIQVIDGKARLVSDVYCDGLGACLGECPQDAITIIEREADDFDEAAAMARVKRTQVKRTQGGSAHEAHGRRQDATLPLLSTRADKPPMAPGADELPAESRPSSHAGGGCPGMNVWNKKLEMLQPKGPATNGTNGTNGHRAAQAGVPDDVEPGLGNWPVQLHLVPPGAPFLQNADLLLVADCVPFALPDFHRRFLDGRPVVIGCPKLDDTQAYLEKLTEILRVASIRSLTVVHIEVPCCSGLTRLAQTALQTSGAKIPFEDVTISIRGKVLERQAAAR